MKLRAISLPKAEGGIILTATSAPLQRARYTVAARAEGVAHLEFVGGELPVVATAPLFRVQQQRQPALQGMTGRRRRLARGSAMPSDRASTCPESSEPVALLWQ
jgi:hypothetical protein